MFDTNQLQLAFNMIEEGVERVKSSDQYKQYLKVMSQLSKDQELSESSHHLK